MLKAVTRHLFEDEQVELGTRKHVSAAVAPVLVAIAGAVLAYWAAGVASGGGVGNWGAAAGIVSAALALWAVIRVLRWRARWIVVTDHRLLDVSGRSRSSWFPLANVSAVNSKRSPAGLMLGYERVDLVAGGRSFTVDGLPRDARVPEALLSRVRTLNLGDEAPSPPPPLAEDSPSWSSTRVYTRPFDGERDSPTPAARRDVIDAVGLALHDRYVVTRRIASGGMGTVYEARDRRLGRPVAVKLLRAELAGDERLEERFRREAHAAASLSHPNVAYLLDYGDHSGTPFLVMELARGRDLGRVLASEGSVRPRRATSIAVQLLRALHHAHEVGVVHRDVKPANVIVGPQDDVKVTDFGIARAAGQSRLTATGTIVGSAPYISPEQLRGEPATPRSDVYAAGIVLYEMVTGAPPFDGAMAEIAHRHLTEPVPPPSRVEPSLAAFDAVLERATAKDPALRFERAVDMAAALEGLSTAHQDEGRLSPARRLAFHGEVDTPRL